MLRIGHVTRDLQPSANFRGKRKFPFRRNEAPTRVPRGVAPCGSVVPRGIFLFVHHYVIHTNVHKRKYTQWYFKGCPFRAQVEHSPNLLLFPVLPSPHILSVRDTISSTYFISIHSRSSCFFKHNFHRARPHRNILVAFELDQRQDGSTFLFPS